MEYYIYVTNDCNLNCSYCSVLFDILKANIPIKPKYSIVELNEFINKIQSIYNDRIADIYFFGGEPTMDYGFIEKVMNNLKSNGRYTINYIMHTNGLLFADAPVNIINNLKLSLISINYEKIFTASQLNDYFYRIINCTKKIKNINDIPLIGRLTISPKTSLYTEVCLFSNYFDYIYWQLDNSECINDFEGYKEKYYKEITLLFEYWLSFFRQGVFLNFVPFISAIKNIVYPMKNKPEYFYCGYGTSMIYIQTNGKCFACCDNVNTQSHLIGDIWKGIEFTNSKLINTRCNNCDYINLCGGRCGRMHKDFDSTRIEQFCVLNKFMFDLIIKNINEIKEIIIKFPDYEAKFNNALLSYTEFTS